MVDAPTGSGKPVLDSLFVDGTPDRTSPSIRQLFLSIDANGVQIAGQVDHDPAFGRRGAGGAMATTTNDDRDLTGLGADELEDLGDVLGRLDESDESGVFICILGETGDGGIVLGITRDDKVTGESSRTKSGLEFGRLRHDI